MKINTLVLGFIFATLIGTTKSVDKQTPDSNIDPHILHLFDVYLCDDKDDQVEFKRELTPERISYFKRPNGSLFPNPNDLQWFLSNHPQYIQPYSEAKFVINEDILSEVLVLTDKQMSMIQFFKQSKAVKSIVRKEECKACVFLNIGIYPIVLRMQFHDISTDEISKILELDEYQINIACKIISEVSSLWVV